MDALLLCLDNTVASAFDAVVRAARGSRLPLFSFDGTAVEHGAVASFGHNQYQTGFDWAKQLAVPVPQGAILAALCRWRIMPTTRRRQA